MSILDTTYYAMTRVRQQGPEARDWATVDKNPEVISLILKTFELHTHTGTTAINYPGYDPVPASIIYPTLTENSSGGVLSPGTTIGVRLAYVNAIGLETQGSSERTITLAAAAAKPLAPTLDNVIATSGALNGGTYIYAITKVKGTGETTISDVLQVSVNYDQAYAVSIKFDALSTYSDGTEKINVYRSAGLAGQFVLVGQINNSTTGTGWTTSSGVTTFTDSNTASVTQQPPANNTFDANKKLTIDWSALGTAPTAATKLRVYVTQQAGLWSVDHLLKEVDITAGAFASNFVDYLGSESLGSGWPLNVSQIPSSPPKVNLTTEATGAPVLTADMDFAGFKAMNMVLGTASVSTNGGLWYDLSSNTIKAYVAGSVVPVTQVIPLTNYAFNPSYEYDLTNTTIFNNPGGTGGGGGSNTLFLTRVSDGSGDGVWTANFQKISGALSSGNDAILGLTGLTGAGGTVSDTSALPTTASYLPATGHQVPVTPGQTIGASVKYRFAAVSTAPNAPQLRITWINSTTGSSTTTIATGSTPAVSSTMSTLLGTATVPAGATYANIYIVFPNSVSATTFDVRIDSVVATKLPAGVTTFSFFDGDTPGASWSGTAGASTSSYGGFTHGVEEGGGHKAQNITFGTSNVGTVLSRIANPTDGSRIQVQPVYQALGTTSAPTTASTSWSNLAEMTLSVTPQFSGQWLEIVFQGNFQVNFAGGTVSVGIDINADGSPGAESVLSYTVPVANGYVPLVIHRYYQAPSSAAVPVTVTWTVSSGAQATSVGIERVLNVKPVF